jgi:small subunit ribosomal protein S2
LKRLEELERLRETNEIRNYSKKMQSSLSREYNKIFRNLNGIRDMSRLPECLVVVDPNREKNAVHEARSLGIKVVALIDTDSDPDRVDLPIPGNDDSLRSIRLIIQHLCDSVKQGKSMRPDEGQKKSDAGGDDYRAVPSIRE